MFVHFVDEENKESAAVWVGMLLHIPSPVHQRLGPVRRKSRQTATIATLSPRLPLPARIARRPPWTRLDRS